MSIARSPDTVVGRFRLQRKLGEGGMGEVWAAQHVHTHKPVALKFLKAEARDPSRAKRLLREARAASAVRHPNVVQIHDVLQLSEHDVVIVMDLLQGEDLAQLLARRGALLPGQVAALLVPVLEALHAAHGAGIVHRDLKPENIFLDQPVAGRVQPKVLDFGIAKLTAPAGPAAQSVELTNTGTVMGSPYYMSPEQIYGEADLDARSDVWALGVILYECLSGKKPFNGDNYGQLFKAITQGNQVPLGERVPDLPPALLELVSDMLCTDREQRVSDLTAVITTLSAQASTGVEAPGLALPSELFVTHPTEQLEIAAAPTVLLTAETAAGLTRSAPLPRTAHSAVGWRRPRSLVIALFAMLSAAGFATPWFVSPEAVPVRSHAGAGPMPAASQATPSAAVAVTGAPTAESAVGEPLAEPVEKGLAGSGLDAPSAASAAPSGALAEGTSQDGIAAAADSTLLPKTPLRRRGPPSNAVASSQGNAAALPPAPSSVTSTPAPAATQLPGSVVSEAPF